ncbi:MAG TPA: biopolymer transporter ExbD [Candidatus Acidoferrales bacterium]
MGMHVDTGKGGAISEMNVIPLIDILLVLIIIFMVITPLTPRGLDALVPQPAPPGAQQSDAMAERTVVVQVMSNGTLKINQEDTTWETMGVRLEEVFKTRAEKVAFVKGEDEVRFADVARAIDIMRASGIEKVGLITARIEAGN